MANLFITRPTHFVWEAFSHAAVIARTQFVHISILDAAVGVGGFETGFSRLTDDDDDDDGGVLRGGGWGGGVKKIICLLKDVPPFENIPDE